MSLRRFLAAACLSCCAAAMLVSAGCSASQIAVYGDESASQAVVAMSDAMGKDVEAVLFKAAGSDDEYQQLGEGQTIWADTDDAKLAFAQSGTFDIRINCTDGSYYELHDVDVAAIANARLCYDAQLDLAYLVYNDASGTEVNTLDNEKQWLEVRAAQLKKAADDQAAADKVIKQIKAIGTVTLDSEKAISKASKAYKKLTKDQRALVKNYKTLKKAKKTLAKLKKEQEEAEAAAQAQESYSYSSDDDYSDSGDSGSSSDKSSKSVEVEATPEVEESQGDSGSGSSSDTGSDDEAAACDPDAF